MNEILSQSGSLENLKKEADNLSKQKKSSFKEKLYLLSVLGDQKATQNFLDASCKIDENICLPSNILVEGKLSSPSTSVKQSVRILSGSGQVNV